MRSTRNRLVSSLALTVTLATFVIPPTFSKPSPWEAHYNAAKSAVTAGDYMQASGELEDALKETAKFKENDPRLGDTYYMMGDVKLRQQEYADARSYFERALYVQQKALEPDSLPVADTLYGLATASEQTGNHQMAVILLKRVFNIWSKRYGSRDPHLTSILPSMATYATLASNYTEAQQFYRQLVAIEEQTLGANSPRLASSLNLLAGSLANTGNFAEAEPLAQRAVDILNRNGTPIALDAATMNLMYIRQRLGKATAAPALTQSDLTTTAVRGTVLGGGESTEGLIAAKPAETRLTPLKVGAAPHAVHAQEQVEKVKLDDDDDKDKDEEKSATASAATTVAAKTASTQPEGSPSAAPANPAKTADQTIASKPATEVIASKPPQAGDTTSTTKQILRPPQTSVATTSSEFRPWELKNATQTSGDAKKEQTNYGKIRYLAGGRLISKEEYEAMLLANEAYEFIRSEKYRMAVEVLNKALAQYPELASGHTNIGLALSQLGDMDGAIDHLRQAIAIDPKRSAPWLNLASAFQMGGHLREAVATYAEYTRRFPNDQFAGNAKELLLHLDKELQEQNEVERTLVAKGGGTNDYFAYASHEGIVRWPAGQQTIHVFISSGSGVSGFKSEYEGFFTDAFKQWAAAANRGVSFQFEKKPDNADIECVWTDDLSKVSEPSEGGETRLVLNSGKQIKHATITVLTKGPSADSPLSPNQVRAVCLHEIGHSLGLVGHSPMPQDVMYCSVPPANAKTAISPRDVATIQRLYSNDATIGSTYRNAAPVVGALPKRRPPAPMIRGLTTNAYAAMAGKRREPSPPGIGKALPPQSV